MTEASDRTRAEAQDEADPPDHRPQADIDVSKPSICRVYDAILGGKNNFAVDRALAAQATRIVPESRQAALYNRQMLGRAVRYIASTGIRQFLDVGSGLPTEENTHQVAQKVAPLSRVVYVDNDPIALSHGRAILAENDRTRVIDADLRDPKGVLGHPNVRGFLDLEQPIGLMLAGVIHHLNDSEDPAAVVRGYVDAIPSGSHVLITHLCACSEEALALERAFLSDLGTGRFRSVEEISAYFDGLEIVEPGVVHVAEWRAQEPLPKPLTVGQRIIVGGVGRKP